MDPGQIWTPAIRYKAPQETHLAITIATLLPATPSLFYTPKLFTCDRLTKLKSLHFNMSYSKLDTKAKTMIGSHTPNSFERQYTYINFPYIASSKSSEFAIWKACQ